MGLSVVGAGRGARDGALDFGLGAIAGLLAGGAAGSVEATMEDFGIPPSLEDDAEASFIAALAFESRPIPSEGGGNDRSSPSSVQSENLLG
jgi:hypothetical protein